MAFKKLKLWFDKDLAIMLAEKIQTTHAPFNLSSFVEAVDEKVAPLELKARVEVIADELYAHLGEDYEHGLGVLMNILGPENKEETGMFTNYYWIMPIAKYVEKYGLAHFTLSMQAIEEITKRNTGEYTIRPFLETYPKEGLAQMETWSEDANFHVRRLASEGVRPRLPWASKLSSYISDPAPILPILHTLKDDPVKYVQKSVANCLNDILKDNPVVAREVVESWQAPDMSKQRKWIIKHALRNLRKAGDSWALEITA